MKGAVHQSFPCGRCLSCRLNNAGDLAIRMMGELLYHRRASFVTLTYNEEHLPEGWNLDYPQVQLFLKRLRKILMVPYDYQYVKGFIGPRYKFPFRYVITGEYGTKNGRPHYHGIFFGVGPERVKDIEAAWSDDAGPIGYVSAFNVTRETCNYVAKYTTKKLMGEASSWYKEAGVVPEKMLSSRRPGIGANFACDYGHEFSARGYLFTHRGNKQRIPRYYKNRIVGINPLAAQRLSDLTDSYLLKKNFDAREKIVRFGYAKVDGMKLLAEEAAKNNARGKESLKRRKL